MLYVIILLIIIFPMSAADQNDLFFMKNTGVYKVNNDGNIVASHECGLVAEDKKHVMFFNPVNATWAISDTRGNLILQKYDCNQADIIGASFIGGTDVINVFTDAGSLLLSSVLQKRFILENCIISKMGVVFPIPGQAKLVATVSSTVTSDHKNAISSLAMIDILNERAGRLYTYPNLINFFSTSGKYVVSIDTDGILHRGSINEDGSYQHIDEVNLCASVSIQITKRGIRNTIYVRPDDECIVANSGMHVKISPDKSSIHQRRSVESQHFFESITDMMMRNSDQLWITREDTSDVELITM